MTGASDGSLAMWSQTKKRPLSVLRRAHGYPHPGLAPANEQVANSLNGHAEESGLDSNAADAEPVGPGSVGGGGASWIGAVGVCKGTDLVVGQRH